VRGSINLGSFPWQVVPSVVPNGGRINDAAARLVVPPWTIGTRSASLTDTAGGKLEILMLMDYPMFIRSLASVLRKLPTSVNILSDGGAAIATFLYKNVFALPLT
jgi:hypothetical protein